MRRPTFPVRLEASGTRSTGTKLNSGLAARTRRSLLRVVYEIHLIGEREREQQLYDLRSTMYFAIAIKGIAASP